MVLPARAKPDARAIVQIKTAFFLVLLWDLERLLPPDTLYALMIDDPALRAQQRRYPLVAVAPIAQRKLCDIRCERLLIVAAFRCAPLISTALAQSFTRSALR